MSVTRHINMTRYILFLLLLHALNKLVRRGLSEYIKTHILCHSLKPAEGGRYAELDQHFKT